MSVPVRDADVLIAGAGPAGAVAAAALARRGLSVLIADPASGGADYGGADYRGADHGRADYDVLISGQARRALASLGVAQAGLAKPAPVIRLTFGARAGSSVAEADAAVCGRGQLLDALRRAAAEAGAVAVPGRVTDIARSDGSFRLQIACAGDVPVLTVAARHLIMATGSAACGSLPPDGSERAAGIACARRFAGVRLRGRLLLTMTPPAATGPLAPPTCVWAIPGPGATVTVATSRMGGQAPEEDTNRLLEEALQTLARADTRFARMTPAGPMATGTLDAGFAPERIATADGLLVGDAAGLINPFTAEGLGYAVESGLLAARSIAEWPGDPDLACQAYARRLSARFVGYFETARYAARRYHLTWRVLDATANSDHPFFAKARRAILLPAGLSGLTTADRLDLPGQETLLLAPFLAACDEVAITTIRAQWPFLARLMLDADAVARPRLRPAVLFFAALLANGNAPDPTRATLAAGIELAQLGALAFLGPPPSLRAPRRGVDWARATTVLAGDFLLAQASRLVAESAPEVSWSFADWLSELTAARAARLDPAGPGAPAGAVFASLFEFPARIGGLLGGAPPETVRALRDVGHHCGHAFLHAEDVLALGGQRTRLDATLRAMLAGRISAIPDLAGDQCLDHRRLAADPDARSAALARSAACCLAARRSALDAAAVITAGSAARILREFADALSSPARAAAESHMTGT
jgi:menaquinone-9 beta-reductase